MGEAASVVVVLVAASSVEEAERIGRAVVESRLAACVNVIPGMTSIYWWDGTVHSESECLMTMKTTQDRYTELEATIRRHHSYQVPEIIALPVDQGSTPYLAWVRQETHK